MSDLGPRIAALVNAAKVNRQRANGNEASAAACLEQAQAECRANGRSFAYWCKRNTGLTLRQAETLMFRGRYSVNR